MRWHAGERVESVEDLPPLDEAVLARRAIVGTPEAVIARLRPWVAAFAGRDLHVLARIQHAGLPFEVVAPAVRSFATEVGPALRSAGAPPVHVSPG
jgi:alkanesulfonate monooxygenase SsuD/methylene tetrahydromethanopterin reductase-like flavin-dependent oxidoreductase (luciferase family)